MKALLKKIRFKYPLFFRIVFLQLVVLCAGTALLFVAYHFAVNRAVRTAINSQKETIENELDEVQEQWRTWKYMSLNDALGPALDDFRKLYQLDYLQVESLETLSPELSPYDLVVPDKPDLVIDYVVHARLSPKSLGPLHQIERIMTVMMACLLALFLATIAMAKLYFHRWFYKPLEELNKTILETGIGHPLKLEHIRASGEVRALIERVGQMEHVTRGYERIVAVGKMASQIACVIKPYLVELGAFIAKKNLDNDPDIARAKIAVQGLENVSNDLCEKHRRIRESLSSIETDETKNTEVTNAVTNHLLYGLVESVVAEKRLQMHARSQVRIHLDTDQTSYGMFVKVKAREFQRLLSHFLEVFAQQAGHNVNIKIKLDGSYKQARLVVSDYPFADDEENLLLTNVEQGRVSWLSKGSLLDKAGQVIRSWGGSVSVANNTDKGTLVALFLPRQPHQAWLAQGIEIDSESILVIWHDDPVVHRQFDTRFSVKGVPAAHVLHFFGSQDFLEWYRTKQGHKGVYLAAYTFLFGDVCWEGSQNSLDLIEELGLGERSVVITGQYRKMFLRNRCVDLGVKILPRGLIDVVPIVTVDAKEKPDCILIANDEHVHVYWRMEARLKGKTVLTFKGPDEFFHRVNSYDKTVPIYVGTQLPGGVKGEEFSRDLNKIGFENIYLSTGQDAARFPPMPWIKGIVDKRPPWAAH